jgi:neutral ceramidase
MYDVADTELEALEGPVQFAHQFVDMPKYTVEVQDPVYGPTTVRNMGLCISTINYKISYVHQVKLCKPAMGYSFAAGTTDGPGAFDFTQGVTSPNDFWNLVG